MRPRLSRPSAPLFSLLILLCLVGVVLRFTGLEFPSGLTWDEHHFVKNARNYLRGEADWNDHPPLGKLAMALSISWLGDDSFSFRLPSVLFGLVSVLAAGVLATRLSGNKLAGFLAAAFISVDGFFIAYSRTALLDGMLSTLTLVALCLMTLRGPWAILSVGLVIGSAMAIKMSGLVLWGPFVALGVLRGLHRVPRVRKHLSRKALFGAPIEATTVELVAYPASLILGVFVYLGWWQVGLSLTHRPHTWSDAIAATAKMMAQHAAATDWTHPRLSRWWTWPIPTKPFLLSNDVVDGGMVRVMTTMGNPLIWWSTFMAVVFTLVETVQRIFNGKMGPWLERAWLVLAYVAYLSPWIVTNRDSYIYHYLPAYGVGIVLLSCVLARWATTRQKMDLLLAGVCLVTVTAAFYAPVWAKLPLSPSALEWRPLIR